MSRVRIVTDSNAYLPPELIRQHSIELLHHRIKVGSSWIEEDESFSADELFSRTNEARARGVERLPDVQAADVNDIFDVYQRLGRETEQIVSIHMSSALSPMYEAARRAADMLKGRYTIRVIDSMSVSFGLGLLVEMAAQAAAKGADVHSIARTVNSAVPHLYVTFFAETLAYLERSASLGPSASLLGSMLGIKAMLMMEEGRLVTMEKVQTRDEVVEKLYEFVVEFASIERVGILQHRYDQAADALRARLAETFPRMRVDTVPYAPSLAAYVGPEMLGVMVYEGTY